MAPATMIGVDIVFLKPKYFAGETMDGTVTVTPTKVEDGLDELTLEITGTEDSYVPSTGWFVHPGEMSTGALEAACTSQYRSFYTRSFSLANLNNQVLEPRAYTWSFSADLPLDAPSTQKTGNVRCQDMWAVFYEAKARLTFNKQNKDRGVWGKTSEVRVWSSPRAHRSTPPKVVGPEVFPVRPRLFFGKSKGISLSLRLKRTTFSLGEPIEVAVIARNPDSVTIKTVEIELVQATTWKAQGIKSRAEKVLAFTTAGGSELGS